MMRPWAPAFLLALAAGAGRGSDTHLQSLRDGHRWFELRDAIQGRDAAPFYKGAVASAFNNIGDAEKYLTLAIQQASDKEAAHRAHGALAYLYARLGRSRDVVRHFDQMLLLKPGSPDVLNARAMFAAFGRYPRQSVARRTRGTIRCSIAPGGFTVAVSINGKALDWGFDTGANICVVSEAEARMLGLTVQKIHAETGDLNSGAVQVGATVAPSLSIGTLEMKNVPMLVLPDSQPPMNALQPGQRGLIGLPVAIAMQTLRWTTGGTFEIAPEPPPGQAANLCFDGLTPVLRVEFAGRQLEMIFDTGAGGGTQLWERFTEDFAALVKREGTAGSKRVTQFGGSRERRVTALPELRLRLGGFDAMLRPANIYEKTVGDGVHHGLLGTDLLTQASAVTVDFRSMQVIVQ